QAGLAELGLEVGDRVGLGAGNTVEFVVGWLATVRGGFVSVPLNPSSPGPELTRELGAVGARAVITVDAEALAYVDRSAVPVLEHVLDAGRVEELAGSAPAEAVDHEAGDLAVLMFTSG